jgi:hypothetical protein
MKPRKGFHFGFLRKNCLACQTIEEGARALDIETAAMRASAIRLARRISIAPVPSPTGRKAGGTHLSLLLTRIFGGPR